MDAITTHLGRFPSTSSRHLIQQQTAEIERAVDLVKTGQRSPAIDEGMLAEVLVRLLQENDMVRSAVMRLVLSCPNLMTEL